MSFLGFGKKKGSTPNQPESAGEEKGVIGEYYENDLPVVVKFINEFPDDPTRRKYPMLTVVSWKNE